MNRAGNHGIRDPMPDGFLELDAEGVFLYADPGAELLLGVTAEDLVGHRAVDVFPASVYRRFQGAHRQAAVAAEANATVEFEEEYAPSGIRLRIGVRPSRRGSSVFLRNAAAGRRPGSEIEAAEAKYRLLVEQLPLVVYMAGLDPLSANIYTSPQCEPLLGYSPDDWTTDPELFAKTLHPDDRARVLAEHERANEAGEPLRIEYRLIAKDGGVVWLRDDSVVVRGADGRPLFRQGFLADLTERRVTESALLDAERRYRSLVDQAPLGIYTNAPDGRLLYVSKQVEQLCGYPADRFMADPDLFWRTIHPDDIELVKAESRRAIEAETEFSLEYRILARDGSIVWILDRTSPVKGADGRTVYRQGFVADVTEEKRRDEALARSEDRFRTAVDRAPIGMSLVAPDGRWLLVNRALCDIVGYSEAELLERTFQDITHPDDLEPDVEPARRLLAGEIQGYDMEKRYFHKDGRIVWVLLSVSLVRTSDGDPLYFIGQIQDITGRRQLEEQLRQSQKLEAVGRLAGGVAHDFNNLLTAISGYSEFLMARHAPGDRDFRDAEQVKRSAGRAAQLTAQLLAFSRRQVLQPQVFRFDDAVGDMEEFLGRLLGEHLEVSTSLGAGGAFVRADRSQIEQVVVNLAVNARDAMPGGGRLTIETGLTSLPDDMWPDLELPTGSYAVLTVSDTGHGMDAGTRAQVFEPFFTTKAVGDGTGLGLATVYGTVKQSGGDVAVTSTPGAGTTFRVLLPLTEAPAAGHRAEPLRAVASAGSETVLLAEDEEVVRALVREILEGRGYTVLEAADPASALELARAYAGPIHILVTDVVMPGMSGRALAETLAPERPDVRVLYTSGYTNGRIADDCDGDPAAFIQKPFSADELAAKVRAVLDGAAQAAAA